MEQAEIEERCLTRVALQLACALGGQALDPVLVGPVLIGAKCLSTRKSKTKSWDRQSSNKGVRLGGS